MKNGKKWYLALGTVCLVIALLVTGIVLYTENALTQRQEDALEELDRNEGTYDTQSIVLSQTSKAQAEKLAKLYDAQLRITKDGKFATLKLPEGTTIRDVYAMKVSRQYLDEMSADYQVTISEDTQQTPVRLTSRPDYTVTDTDYALQTYLDYLNMGDVWGSYTGEKVTVAVIDTGIDTDHPEFAGRISEYSYNASEDKIVKDYQENGDYAWSLIEDQQGHGTLVTGVIAASMNSGNVVGIAPEVEIIVIKAECDDNGTFLRSSDLVYGVYYAIERDAQVVNMSFGGEADIFSEALQLAYDSDVICVAAAGNDGTATPSFPAADPNVIAVGALEANSWLLAEYSNYGENVDLVAPGTVYTTTMGGGYGYTYGTSFAAPIVTGAIALYMQSSKYATFDEVTEILYASCCDLGDLGKDWYYGFGALDIHAFLKEERGTVTFNMLTDEVRNLESVFIHGHALQELPEPERLYAIFDGWYYDYTFTQPYDYYADAFYDDVTLYAKWTNEDDGVPYTYVILDDGTVEIRSYTGHRRYITIPEKIDGRVVSSIGDFAFAGETNLREVTLPSGLTTIGDYAFDSCVNMVSVKIPSGVTSIGYSAFYNNVRLNAVIFESDSHLRTIDSFAFSGCSRLERIELPASLEVVDGSAFAGATWLESITVQKGNTHFKSKDGVLFSYSGNTLVAFPAAWGTAYTLPEGVTTIGTYGFAYAKLSEIDLNHVATIEESAFERARLTKLTIPESVQSVGKLSFAYNEYLSSVTIEADLNALPGGIFAYSLRLTTIEIPNSVMEIGEKAFYHSGLESVTFEEGSTLQQIQSEAFKDSRLKTIMLPDSLRTIESGAFEKCKLKTVTIGEESSLEKICGNAFAFNKELNEIHLPASLRTIESMAFYGSGLIQIHIPSSLQSIGFGAFSATQMQTITVDAQNPVYYAVDNVLHTRDNQGNVWLHTYPTGRRITTYTVADDVVTIAPYAFAGTKILFGVTLPEGMTVLGEYAFAESGIMEIDLPQALERIEEGTFYRCKNLKTIHIPDNVIHIGPRAFAQSSDLESITFHETSKLPRIGIYAFAQSGITSFRVPANVYTIAQSAFEKCTNLKTITFAENSRLESISAYMLNGCENLETITFEQGSALKQIQAHGLEGMDKLTSVDFGNAKIREIDNFAFRFCGSLTSLSLPDSLQSVGRYAFYCCESMTQLTFPEALEHIGSYAFLGTKDIELYFLGEAVPAYLDENWDHGVRGYYLGVSSVETSGDFRYAVLKSGNIAILEYLGSATHVDLTALDLGGEITVIGGSAFEDSAVRTIVLPQTLTTIQAEAFRYTALESVSIPACVTFIGREAFAYTEIERLIFEEGSSLQVIEQYAFEKTENLKSVILPASLTTMGTGAFCESGLESLTFAEGIALTEIPQKAFADTKLITLALPDSVTLVNHNAFHNVQTLKSVSFGSNEGIRLMSNAFYHTGLESLYIPENVLFIGEYSFIGLENLQEYTVSAENPNYCAVDGLLMSKDGRKLIAVPGGRTGSLTVPKSVESIGFGAFEESKLSAVYFDEDANILTFGYRAFFGAENITTITIPKSVVSIDYYAFGYCENLQEVIFAEGNQLKGIYEGAFIGCIRLENIVIPDSIVEISDFAFYGCSKIDELPISDHSQIKGIYDYAFAYTGLHGEFTTPETLWDIGNYAFMSADFTSVTVPDTQKKALFIGLGAFEACDQLTEITLPFLGRSFDDDEASWFGYIFGAGAPEANETYIPQSLKTVTITEGITTVYKDTFHYCTGLETLNLPDTISVIWEGAFYGTTARYELTNIISPCVKIDEEWLTNVYYRPQIGHFGTGITGSVTLDDRVDIIYSSAFGECVNLENVVMPEGLTTIEAGAFGGCSSLIEAIVPQSVTGIDFSTWENCTSLEKVVLPENVTIIPASLFAGCSSLKEVQIPENVTEIGSSAFGGCTNLTEIVIPEKVTWIGDHAFASSGITEIKLPDSVTFLGIAAFSGCQSLKSASISDGVKEIGREMFYQCKALEQVEMASDAALVGRWMFWGCNSLKEIVIPTGTTTIPEQTFYSCDNLTDITIPNTVTSVKYGAFEYCQLTNVYISDLAAWCNMSGSIGCKNLYLNGKLVTDLVIPDSVTAIPDGRFSGCTSIQSVTIPGSVESVGNSAFAGCTNLTSVTIQEGVKTIGNRAFDSLEKLETVSLPDSLTAIGDEAFRYCENLRRITIPKGVKTIGQYAFFDCRNLTDVELQEGLETLGFRVFYRCNIPSITIPSTMIQIGEQAFCENYNLYYVVNKSDLSLTFGASDHGHVACYAKVIEDKSGNRTNVDGSLVTADGFVFTTIDDVYTLISYIGSNTTVTLPESVNGKTYSIYRLNGVQNVVLPSFMTEVPEQAFFTNSKLKSVTFAPGTTKIGDNAFNGCSNLQSITLPNTLTSIGGAAFGNCSGLTEITIPSTVTSLGSGAFAGCTGLTTVTIPKGITEIQPRLFMDCSNLQSVNMTGDVKSIEESAFEGCVSLESIHLPDSLEYIGKNAFVRCKKLASIQIPAKVHDLFGCPFDSGTEVIFDEENPYFRMENGILYNAEMTNVIFADRNLTGKVILPNTVKDIGYEAFKNCTGITEIVLPKGLATIGYDSFSGCTGITEILLPEGLKTISSKAFSGCTALAKVIFPSTLQSVGDQAFMSCSSLADAQLPSGISYLGNYAFAYCDFTEFTIPQGVTSVPSYMLAGCSKLEKVTLSDSVESIGYYAFDWCSNLTSIRIPKSVNYIWQYAFNGTNIKRVDIEDLNAWLNITFESTVMSYEGAEMYCNGVLVEHVAFPAGTTAIGQYALHGCSSLKSVEIPNTVTSIGQGAFASCANLQKVVIPEGVTVLEWGTFEGCTGIKSITLPEGLQRIDGSAFSGCTNLESINLPDSVTEIGRDAFNRCESLMSIRIPSGLTTIQPHTFFDCRGLKTVVIPEGVTEIGYNAFYLCTALEEVYIPESMTSIGSSAFYDCPKLRKIHISSVDAWCRIQMGGNLYGGVALFSWNLYQNGQMVTHITIPNDVTEISEFAFTGFEGLEHVTIPGNVTTIGQAAFMYCTGLQTVTFSEGLKTIENSAFYGCEKLMSVSFPDSLETVGTSAFSFCGELHRVRLGKNLAQLQSNAFLGATKLNYIVNHSSLAIAFDNADGSYLDYNAEVVEDVNGNLTYREEGYFLDDNYFFYQVNNGEYTMLAYLGDKETVTLPMTVNGQDYEMDCVYGLRYVVIPDGMTQIKYRAFRDCNTLLGVTIPNSVTEICGEAFYQCRSLRSIHMPDSITQANTEFWYCERLEEVTLSKNLTTLPVFGYSHSLRSIEIPEGIRVIPRGAFSGCTGLTEIILPESVEEIGYSAFSWCENLHSINFPDTIKTVGGEVFSGCHKLWENPEINLCGVLYLNGWVMDIGEDVLYLPHLKQIKGVAPDAYDDCNKLKNYLWGRDALYGIPSNVETIYIRSIYAYMPTPSNSVTLKNIILSDEIGAADLRHCLELFANVSGITIWVEEDEENLRWDDNFPGWNNDNRVYYGDEWTMVEFYAPDGGVISSEPRLCSQIIRRPVYETEADDRYIYELVGWDMDGDGVADSVPATSAVDVKATAVIQKRDRKYTVSFVDRYSGNIYAQMQLPYGSTISLPDAPEKQGYSFLEWDISDEEMTVTADMTIYARWLHHGNGHQYDQKVWVDATCVEPGYYKHTCTVCGEYYRSGVTEPLGHAYSSTVVNPTCTVNGYTLHDCDRCDENYRDAFVPATGHNYGSWIVDQAATCTETGLHHRICDVCNDRQDGVISMEDHTFVITEQTQSTCLANGKQVLTCTACGETITETLPLAEHDYQKKYDRLTFFDWLIQEIEKILWGYEGDRSFYYECACCGQIRMKEEETPHRTGMATASAFCRHRNTTESVRTDESHRGFSVTVLTCDQCGKVVSVYAVDAGETKLLGDVNLDGEVDAEDLTVLARHVAGIEHIATDDGLANADVDGNGEINAEDLTRHARFVAGIITDWNQG